MTSQNKNRSEKNLVKIDLVQDFNWLKFFKQNWYLLVFFAAVIFLIYGGSLGSDFASDDKGMLRYKDDLLGFKFIFYDPFSFIWYLSYAVIYKICGFAPICFRSVNIFYHLINAGLVFIIVYLLHNRRVAFLTAALFSVHPLLIEAITWISGGVYSQYSVFFLLSFLFYVLSRKNRRYYSISLITFIFGLFTSNRLMSLFPIFIVYEFAYGSITGGLRKNWIKLIPYVVLSLGWAAHYIVYIPARVESLNQYDTQSGMFHNPFVQIPFAIIMYLWLLLWPDHLSFAHSIIDITPRLVYMRLVFMFLLLVTSIYFLRKNRQIFFWISFTITTLLITLTPFKLSWVVAERYMYLGSIGVFVIFSLIINRLMNLRKIKIPLIILSALIICLLGWRGVIRNRDWKDDIALAHSTLRENPRDIVARNFLGSAYGEKKDYDNAIKQFEIGLGIDPDNFLINYNLGYVYQQKKQYDQSVFFFIKAHQIEPESIQTLQKLSEVCYEKGDWDKVIEYTLLESESSPQNPILKLNLAKAYLQKKDELKAREYFEEALKLDPNNQSAKKSLEDLSR